MMIHEFGHYVTKNKEQSYLIYDEEYDFYFEAPKKHSFLQKITNTTSWSKMSSCVKDDLSQCIKKVMDKMSQCGKDLFKSGEFVTVYASSSLDEDAAETFAHFVLSDEKPQAGINGAKDKILLFYDDPKMVQIREAIRANLKKRGHLS